MLRHDSHSEAVHRDSLLALVQYVSSAIIQLNRVLLRRVLSVLPLVRLYLLHHLSIQSLTGRYVL